MRGSPSLEQQPPTSTSALRRRQVRLHSNRRPLLQKLLHRRPSKRHRIGHKRPSCSSK
ncbi:hypothetical protein B0H17DRAFT_1097026 [Mycena rosella]|uniref:Uncharacterized protein n=1 Tax=Mycena rosella TaxID=1033263 RepID=A0AAD7CQS3_MYCRO|nr:hypothetical protein B0H17DRAFT_1097026 [Mycena rosella]